MVSEEKIAQYSLTRKDIFVFNICGCLRLRVVQIFYLLGTGFLMLQVFNTPALPGHSEPPPLAARIFAAILMGITCLVFISVMLLTVSFLLTRRQGLRKVLGQYELKLSDDGMMTRGPTSETLRKWNGLLKVISTKSYLFLYVTGTSAQIIPKRCFASPAEALSFEATIRERMKSN